MMNGVLSEATIYARDISSLPYNEVRDLLNQRTFACVKGLFDPEEVLQARQRVENKFDYKNDRKHDPADSDAIMANFQKLVVGGTAGVNSVPRFLRMFYNPLFAEDIFGMHDVFRRLIRFRNLLYALPETFTLGGIEDGMWSACRIHQYPRGGGFMAVHTDVGTANLSENMGLDRYVQVILIMSQQGIDFHKGGAYIEIDGKRHFYESECELGDVIVYDGRVRHGVEDMDPLEPLEIQALKGRCVALATLFKHFTQNTIDEYRALMR